MPWTPSVKTSVRPSASPPNYLLSPPGCQRSPGKGVAGMLIESMPARHFIVHLLQWPKMTPRCRNRPAMPWTPSCENLCKASHLTESCLLSSSE